MTPTEERSSRTGSFASLPSEEPFPGVRRRALSASQLTLSRYEFEPGASFPLHSHPQEQLTLVEAGSVEMTIAGSPQRLAAGEWSIVAPQVEHGITAGGDGARILAIVSPARAKPEEYRLSGEAGGG